jgi:hypothetical protein
VLCQPAVARLTGGLHAHAAGAAVAAPFAASLPALVELHDREAAAAVCCYGMLQLPFLQADDNVQEYIMVCLRPVPTIRYSESLPFACQQMQRYTGTTYTHAT